MSCRLGPIIAGAKQARRASLETGSLGPSTRVLAVGGTNDDKTKPVLF